MRDRVGEFWGRVAMTKEERALEEELKREAERTFEEKRRKLGVDAKLDLLVNVFRGPPEEANVYGEAFPFERPPRVRIEVFPEATGREIAEIVCEELLHVKHPGLSEEEIRRMVPRCVGSGG